MEKWKVRVTIVSHKDFLVEGKDYDEAVTNACDEQAKVSLDKFEHDDCRFEIIE